MGHHLTPEGRFKSDKYPWCPEGFIALKFTDPLAQTVLLRYAQITMETELKSDIRTAVARARGMKEVPTSPPRYTGFDLRPNLVADWTDL